MILKEHNLCAHPGIEVYDDKNIYFMFPLAKQNQFYHLYNDNDEETSDDNTDDDEDDQPEQEKPIEEKLDDTGIQMRLRSAKKSSNSSTSSSFEELVAEESSKDS